MHIHTGTSCLLASTRSGTPSSASLLIIFSGREESSVTDSPILCQEEVSATFLIFLGHMFQIIKQMLILVRGNLSK